MSDKKYPGSSEPGYQYLGKKLHRLRGSNSQRSGQFALSCMAANSSTIAWHIWFRSMMEVSLVVAIS